MASKYRTKIERMAAHYRAVFMEDGRFPIAIFVQQEQELGGTKWLEVPSPVSHRLNCYLVGVTTLCGIITSF